MSVKNIIEMSAEVSANMNRMNEWIGECKNEMVQLTYECKCERFWEQVQ